MQDTIVKEALGMTRGSLLRIEDGRDLLIYVWEGELWLTQERDNRDHFVRAGSGFRLDRGGATVAYALERCLITLSAPEPALYARRMTLVRAGGIAALELYNSARLPLTPGRRLALKLGRVWAGLFAPQARSTAAVL